MSEHVNGVGQGNFFQKIGEKLTEGIAKTSVSDESKVLFASNTEESIKELSEAEKAEIKKAIDEAINNSVPPEAHGETITGKRTVYSEEGRKEFEEETKLYLRNKTQDEVYEDLSAKPEEENSKTGINNFRRT